MEYLLTYLILGLPIVIYLLVKSEASIGWKILAGFYWWLLWPCWLALAIRSIVLNHIRYYCIDWIIFALVLITALAATFTAGYKIGHIDGWEKGWEARDEALSFIGGHVNCRCSSPPDDNEVK